MQGLEFPIPTLAVQQFIVAEDTKVRLALRQAPWAKAVLAELNASLLRYAGDEQHQEVYERE